MKGNGLAKAGGIVLDGDVLQNDAVTLDFHRVGAEGAHPLLCAGEADVGMVVESDDGVFHILANDFYVVEPRGDDYLLLVGAFFHKNHLVVVHEGTAHLYGVVDVAEFACAVASDEQGVGVVILVHCQC